MRPIDFFKATVACGFLAYFAYTIPALSQGIIIGMLCLLWASYLFSTLRRARAR